MFLRSVCVRANLRVKGREEKKKQKGIPGPKPETFKIEGSWKDAVKKSFQKQKPAEGWPQPKRKRKSEK